MNKWIAIPVIAVLAIALAGGGYFLWQQTDKLGEAESEIVVLEGNVATLEGEVSTLETKLADSEAEVSTLTANLTDAQSQISSLQSDLAAAEALYDDFKSDVTSRWASLLKTLELVGQTIKLESSIYKKRPGEEQIAIFKSFDPLVEAIGDRELSRLWGEAWPNTSRAKSEQQKKLWLYFDEYSRFLDRLCSLAESDIDKLVRLVE